MSNTIISAAVLILSGILLSCNDDEERTFTSIEGEWRGTLAEIQVKPFGLPLPFSEDIESFDTRMEFKPDGTVTVDEGGQSVEGTYQRNNDKLIIDIDMTIASIELAGTYTLETLDDATLIFFTERNDTFSDPDGGPSISGKVKVTLHFARIRSGVSG